MKNLKNKKCLVTGAAGFIGSHLVDKLVEEGAEVYGIDNMYQGNIENLNPVIHFSYLDFTNERDVLDYFKKIKPDYVFHVGAWSRMPMCLEDPVGACKNNTMGSVYILEASRRVNVKKVVLSSSCIVYCEETPYKASKIAMEDMAKVYRTMYDLSTVSLRYSNVYGTRQEVGKDSAMFAMLKQTLQEKGYVNIFGDGEQTRDWTHVDDICRANIYFALSDFQGEIDIATGKSLTLNYIINFLKLEKKHLPERKGDAKHITLDPKPAEELGFKTNIKFEDGIINVWKNL